MKKLFSVQEKDIKKKVFGGTTFTSICERTPALIPPFLSKLIDCIIKNSIQEEGIFRMSGKSDVIKEMVAEIEETLDINLEKYMWQFEPADVLKRFFRELEDGLCVSEKYNDWSNTYEDDHVNKEKLKEVIKSLPNSNQYMLQLLMFVLKQVSLNSDYNKMNANNLGIIWGPNLIKKKSQSVDISEFADFQKYIVEELIVNYTDYFSESVGPYSPALLHQKLCFINCNSMCVNSDSEALLPQSNGSINHYNLSSNPCLPPLDNVFPPYNPIS